VRGTRRADHAKCFATVAITNLFELLSDYFKCFFPCGGNQTAVLLHERLHQPVFVIGKVERVTSLNTQEVAIHAALVAVVAANDLHAGIRAPDTQRGLASVCTVRARGADVLHLPWTRLVPVRTRSECAHR